MSFVKNDKVILVGSEGVDDKSDSPIWGGKYGYVIGTVTIYYREDGHDYVKVKWPNGCTKALYAWRFRRADIIERSLSSVTGVLSLGSLRPYKKYFGLVMLVIVVDYFFLGSRLKNRLKDVASNFVNKILGLPAEVIEGDK